MTDHPMRRSGDKTRLPSWLSADKVAWVLTAFFAFMMWQNLEALQAGQKDFDVALTKLKTWADATEKDRFRKAEALELEKRILDEVRANYPPPWLKEDIKDMQGRLSKIERTLDQILADQRRQR